MKTSRILLHGALLTVVLTFLLPATVAAQGQGRGQSRSGAAFQGVTMSVEVQSQVRAFYDSRDVTGVEALPPGIRRRLERGKPLPPGIARKSVPQALTSAVALPAGYELVEVGLDVLLVEAATGVVHDLLMDVIR